MHDLRAGRSGRLERLERLVFIAIGQCLERVYRCMGVVTEHKALRIATIAVRPIYLSQRLWAFHSNCV
jgi:hypothetical protein